MLTPEEMKEQARAQARNILSQSQTFLNLPQSEQMEMYKRVIDEQYQLLAQKNNPNLAQQSSLATSFAADVPNRENKDIKAAGDTTRDFVKKVDFPSFVRDLLVGVFDANLDANERQMDSYKRLLREAIQDVTEFVKKINDAEAYDKLAEDNGYTLKYQNPRPIIFTPPNVLDKNQNPVNSSEVTAKLNAAKLAMAQERRTLLRETLLMGVSRLVVEQGTIQAKVNFSIDANQNNRYHDNANEQDNFQENQSTEVGYKSWWGGSSASDRRDKSSNISIITNANADTTNDTKLHTDLMGFVEIKFKSDYFKLDNFKEIFDKGKGWDGKTNEGKPNETPASDQS